MCLCLNGAFAYKCISANFGMQPKLGMKSFAVYPTLIRSVTSQANGHTHIASPLCQCQIHDVSLHACFVVVKTVGLVVRVKMRKTDCFGET